jgi:hypothetical protein
MLRSVSTCALLVLIAASGCRMCQSYTDYAPVVPDGPYSQIEGRAGSILSGSPMPIPTSMSEPLPNPTTTEKN